MRRYGLRDDQWVRIEGLLPGRAGSVGVTAAMDKSVCLSRQCSTGTVQVSPGVTFRNASATGRTSTVVSAAGQNPVSGGGFSSISPRMPTPKMR